MKSKKVGIIRGRFELIHPGHIELFYNAKKLVDQLVVLIDGEKYIKEKGERLSINSDNYREQCLSILPDVDDVFVFDSEEEFKELVEHVIHVNNGDCDNVFYFKGGDYAPANLPEAEVLRKLGVVVACLSYNQEYSTTKTIEKILECFLPEPPPKQLSLFEGGK
jgi:D-beta-D-heptose 7-phosphate kinase/D-beta-D-heptose 1-phosphate adenosyltransferase